jgi:hypothetical protein
VHSKLSSPLYPAELDALLAWIDNGERPTPQAVLDRCHAKQQAFPGDCTIDPAYQVAPFESRSWPRTP